MSLTSATKQRSGLSKAQLKSQILADLIDEMSWILSQPPTRIGARIRPEEELANELGLTRRQVREAIGCFTDKGVLVRRQGSGTYVRRVHSHPPDSRESRRFGLTHEMLFQDLPSNDLQTITLPKSVTGKTTRSLRIGLWTEWQLSPPHTTTHVVLMMFMRHAQLAGHTLTIHSQVASSQVPLPVQEMARQLREASDDGFLVGSQYADTFLEARKLAGSDCPYLFHIMGTGEFDLRPTIELHTLDACEKALNKLVAAGHKTIGTIAMVKSPQCDLEHHVHQSVMHRANLREDLCVYSRDMGVASGMEATRELLTQSGGKLDAIYVANDMVLVGVTEALTMAGLTPGRDIAVITLANRGYPLPSGYDWSVMEFDPESFASVTIRQLCHQIEYPELAPVNLSIQATWKPGKTYLLNG